MSKIKFIVHTRMHFSNCTSYYLTYVTRVSDGLTVAFIPDCDRSASALVRDTYCTPNVWDGSIHDITQNVLRYRDYNEMAKNTPRCSDSKRLKKLFRDEKKRLKQG